MKSLPEETHKKYKDGFFYELKTTKRIFEIASDLGLKLVVKPHKGEKFEINYTKNLTAYFGFTYIPAGDCDTKQLMLSASSVSAGRTTCLDKACLLGINVAGLFPGLSSKDVAEYNSIKNKAIPYTFKWEEVPGILQDLNSQNPAINNLLEEKRRNFSVKGGPSAKLADIIEREIFSR